jgi:hypothetical protein|tara:strand:+ start:1183 stop:1665 length:483 start_codon:yes stop_codon:yes gene_type:complete
MQLIPNFLEPEIFKKIKETVFSNEFPFYYSDQTGSLSDDSDFMFSHKFFSDNNQQSGYFSSVLMPILGKLSFNYLIRAKLNFYTKKNKFIYTEVHRDSEEPHTVALYSFNTNNGFTYFEDNREKVPSLENQLCLFNGLRRHCSVAQTDTKIRANININIR